jgi:hypothetical protein
VRFVVGVAALVALVSASAASAHGPGGSTSTGYVASVSGIEPTVVGLRAQPAYGDQILVSNLSPQPIVIFDAKGLPFLRFTKLRGVERRTAGGWKRVARTQSYAWHDPRVVGHGPPPAPAPGAGAGESRFVKNWRIPGDAGGRDFEILGFLGWVPPPDQGGDGVSKTLLVAGALGLLALSIAAVVLLGRREGDPTSTA